MKNILLYVWGCECRALDAQKLSKYFLENGYCLTNNAKNADLIFFIACGATDIITKSSLDKVKQLKSYNSELIVGGCVPETDKVELSKIFNGTTMVTKNLNQNPDKIDSLLPNCKIKFSEINDANRLYKNSYGFTHIEFFFNILFQMKLFKKFKKHVISHVLGIDTPFGKYMVQSSLYVIRISWGCMGRCAYCAIRNAIGDFESKPLNECILELKKGLGGGADKYLLVADEMGAYGLDKGTTFPKLLRKMTDIDKKYSISIRHLDPRWIVRYIDDIEKILSSGKIDSIDIPIQSGNNRILKVMNRYDNINKIKESIKRLQIAYPNIHLHTHIIVGFPTESWDEFRQSLEFVTDLNLQGGLFFPFSSKPGTKAEKLDLKIPKKEVKNRLKYFKKYLKRHGYLVIYLGHQQHIFFKK